MSNSSNYISSINSLRPVFFLGCSRTGSKIYMNILRKHSEIDVAAEMHYLEPFWLHRDFVSTVRKEIGDPTDDKNLEQLVNLIYSKKLYGNFWKFIEFEKKVLFDELKKSNRSFKDIFKTLITLQAIQKDKRRPGAKFPVHFSYLNTLVQWFPNSKIVFLFRDPRAIYVSQTKKYLNNEKNYLKNIIIKFKMFIHINVMCVWAFKTHQKYKHLDNYYLSKYEDIVAEPEINLRNICDFLEIDYSREMLKPPVKNSSFETKLNKGFNRDSINRWRNFISPFSASLIKKINTRSMRSFGYIK